MNDENILSRTMVMVATLGTASIALVGALSLGVFVLAKTVGPQAAMASSDESSKSEPSRSTSASPTKPASGTNPKPEAAREAATQKPKTAVDL
ncbi:MAG: hypothetical protein U0169_19700 [Polyangiaceae bacterium]